MNRSFSRFVLLGFLCLFPLLAAPASAQESSSEIGGVTVLGPDDEYAGVSRGEWEARWWQWSASLPLDVNPNFDPAGAMCGYGQSGPMFFVPGNFTGAPQDPTCTVPEGVALYVPVVGGNCSSIEEPPFFGRNEEELTACARRNNDMATGIAATINGENVPNLTDYRVNTPMFTLNFPENNFFGVPVGTALSVADSYSFIIAPLSPGEYDIAVSSLLPGETKPFVGTIHIVVVEPTIITPGATPEASPEIATPTS